jgi:transcriptional regulator with XRE-family HTH domain
MPKLTDRATSRYAREALTLFGQLIRAARLERHMTSAELAERAGISRGLLHRLETGHPGTSLGVAFEVAAILGVPLFESEQRMTMAAKQTQTRLHLLPKTARRPTRTARDDF